MEDYKSQNTQREVHTLEVLLVPNRDKTRDTTRVQGRTTDGLSRPIKRLTCVRKEVKDQKQGRTETED